MSRQAGGSGSARSAPGLGQWTVLRVGGTGLTIDPSWLLIFAFVTWTTSTSVIPIRLVDEAVQSGARLTTLGALVWVAGAITSLLFFGCILLHEAAHALVAVRTGIPVRRIRLFIFGGVAEMEQESPSARAEFMVTIAGPIASFVIALVFFGCAMTGEYAGWAISVTCVMEYLARINGLLAVFNLIPAFPLDGGRILRSALWTWKDNLPWATRIASMIGSGFGTGLIGFGVLSALFGNVIGGLWWCLIGMFLRNAAGRSYEQLMLRKALEGEKVREFMQPETMTAPETISVEELMDDYVYTHHFKMFPVVRNGALIGCVTTRRVKELPRDAWRYTTVRELAEPCSQDNSIHPDMDAMQALAKMKRADVSRLLVVDDGHLVGIVTLKDLLEFLSFKAEMEEDAV